MFKKSASTLWEGARLTSPTSSSFILTLLWVSINNIQPLYCITSFQSHCTHRDSSSLIEYVLVFSSESEHAGFTVIYEVRLFFDVKMGARPS